MRRRLGIAGTLLIALLAAGCGATTPPPNPRGALTTVLADLASGDVAGVCDGLAPGAVDQLALEFGGANCRQTVSITTRYVASASGEQRAVGGASVLSALDLPLSPAPYYPGETAVRVRVRFNDPILGRLQFVDISLRLEHGRWRISAGLAALFTLLG